MPSRCAEHGRMEDIHSKLADHAFEMIKFFISLVTFVGGLYVTLLGAYLAFQSTDAAQTSNHTELFWFMNAISVGTIAFVWGFLWIVRRTAFNYGRYLNLLDHTQQNSNVERALSVLMPVGTLLAAAATGAIAFAIFIIWSI